MKKILLKLFKVYMWVSVVCFTLFLLYLLLEFMGGLLGKRIIDEKEVLGFSVRRFAGKDNIGKTVYVGSFIRGKVIEKKYQNDYETQKVLKRLSDIHVSSINIDKKNLGDSMHLIWKSYKKDLESPKIDFVVMYKAKYLYGKNEDYEKKTVSINIKNTNLSAVINQLCILAGFNWSIQYDKYKSPFVLLEPKEKQK